MQQLNNTSAAQGQQQHKRLPSRLFVALFFLLPLVGWGQPFTVTTDEDNPVLYWIESYGKYVPSPGFYLIPHNAAETNGTTKISTTNSPCMSNMLWYFVEAGTYENKTFYYIVHNETKKCLYHYDNNDGGIRLGTTLSSGLSALSDAERKKHWFYVEEKTFSNPDGTGYYIRTYAKKSGTPYYVNKKDGNVKYVDYVRPNTVNDETSGWLFIAKDNVQWPQPTLPFVTSTDTDKHYYFIHNVGNSSMYMSYKTSNSVDYATISSADNTNRIWYFKEAATDATVPNLKYYYIVNAVTGKYMKFTGTANGSNQQKVIQLTSHEGDDDAFQFVVVNSYGGLYSAYSIMPKSCFQFYANQANSLKPNNGNNNTEIGIYPDREYNSLAHWNFEEVTNPVSAPVIGYNYSNKKATFTCATSNSTIYYTYSTDGSEPPTPDATSTPSSTPLTLTTTAKIKAIAEIGDFWSTVTSFDLVPVSTIPVVSVENNAIVISSVDNVDGFYYTKNGNDPVIGVSGTSQYTGPMQDGVSNKTIKAIAVKANMLPSGIGMGDHLMLNCGKPVITCDGTNFTVSATGSFPSSGVTVYYTHGSNPDDPTPSSSSTTSSVTIPVASTPYTVKAYAVATDYNPSEIRTVTWGGNLAGTGEADDPFVIANATDFLAFQVMAGNATYAGKHYKLTNDIEVEGNSTISQAFTGVLEASVSETGRNKHMYHTISGLTEPIFATIDGGTVRNLNLDAVSIAKSGKVGAIACTAKGTSRIYNVGILGGSVGGTQYTGGLVGSLEEQAHVVNCFSYANITGGSNVGGIVGYNNVASKQSNINTTTHVLEATMVMNCMFYGDITGGTTVSPVYGGQNINNLNSGGLNTFNYYSYENLITKSINSYYCALAVEEKYLNRFEFYRLLLNSNKKLAAIYATGNLADTLNMAKWVLETADRSIADPKPYPVLKERGVFYPSIINPDFTNAPDSTAVGPNKGGNLGRTLLVTIKARNGWSNAPTNAKLLGEDGSPLENTETRTIPLTRTDKDFDRFNFNYDKVQLPYYNDYGTLNYTSYKVVTGWKITSITGGTTGTYTAEDSWNGYNFADRNCTNKDLYGTGGSNRVFAQGAYWDVPYGVTAITIEPYWGNAAYVADEYYDVVYNTGYTRQDVTGLGTQVESTSTFNGQTVKSTVNDALGTITSPGSTVYDNAIVLVGNFHQSTINGDEYQAPFNGTTPFTLMSVDMDNDKEPDYSLIFHDTKRSNICSVRFDFLNIIGTAQAQKPNGADKILNVAVFNPKSWFEITNTCLIYFSQFEYEHKDVNKTGVAPVILLGGVYDQFVSTQSKTDVKTTTYLHVGGNVWFKDFGNGTHSDGSGKTKHIPISVTGGDFDGFYLTGTYRSNASVYSDDAECYISGGRFKEAAGAGQEQINGNVRWQIYDADIEYFYGGGIKAPVTIKGNVTVDIFNSRVTTYCGGPKFGDMQTGKKVATNATGCEFGRFFGAGYGGNSINRQKYTDHTTYNFNTLQNYYLEDRGKYFDGATTELWAPHQTPATSLYGYKGPGVATDFDYEFFVWTSGAVGARFYVKYVYFSLAQCNNVESTLKRCIINENFYGGGSLGKVMGNAVSELDDCEVKGNVFGAGFSASLPTIVVRDAGFTKIPNYNKNSGMFEPGVFSGTTVFQWEHVDNYPAEGGVGFDGTNIITTINLGNDNLGSVEGNITLTLKGNTTVGTLDGGSNLVDGTGNVYGGGDESAVTGNTEVRVLDHTKVHGNIYGGGNEGIVGGNTKVIVNGK